MLNLNQKHHLPHNSLPSVMARTDSQIEEAQRPEVLKYLLKRWAPLWLSAHEGIDCDIFDPISEHLLVRDNSTNKVIGTIGYCPPTVLEPSAATTRKRVLI